MTAQLFPREPRRMKQPAKDVLREQLSIAADRIIELSAENHALREAMQSAASHLFTALPDPST